MDIVGWLDPNQTVGGTMDSIVNREHFVDGEQIDSDEDLAKLGLSRSDVVDLVNISQMVAAYNAHELGYSESDDIPTRAGWYWSWQLGGSLNGPFETRDKAIKDLRDETAPCSQ